MSTTQRITQQTKHFEKVFTEHGIEYVLLVTARYDDQYGNGHNSFGLTGEIWHARQGKKIGRDCESCGCLHREIATHFPELLPYIQWHLTSADGPMYYIENTRYHVTQGRLDVARSTAVWLDATDEDLTAPELEDRLKARLPQLMLNFQSAMESLGFAY